MAVRQDKVQIILEYLTEESKSLSQEILNAQKLQKEIRELAKEERKLAEEAQKLATAGKSNIEIEEKRKEVIDKLNSSTHNLLMNGQNIKNLDLSKVANAQLVTTAKELQKAIEFIPKSSPQYETLAAALKKVNDQLAANRAETKGAVERLEKVDLVLTQLDENAKSLANIANNTKSLTTEIETLLAQEQRLNQEYERALKANQDTVEIEVEKIRISQKLASATNELLKTGQHIEKLDLTKIAPRQLNETARQLKNILESIPQTAPEYEQLAKAFLKVDNQIKSNNENLHKIQNEMDKSRASASAFGEAFQVAFGVSMANAAENFVGRLKEIGVGLFQRSRELEAFGNKAKNVFGEAYNDMVKFADGIAGKVGQSVDQTMKDLTQTSNSFKTLEFDDKYIPQLTKQIYTLSAAWSAYNVGQYSVTQTSETLMKALGGEVDELNEIGIVLTEDTMKKEMQKRGYDKLTGASYDQAAALVMLELVTRKTKDAQSAFGATSESIGVKQNRINAVLQQSYDNLAKSATGFFNNLVSIGAKIMDFIAPQKTLIETINKTQDAFNRDIYVLQNANLKTEERKRLINEMNKEYKQYLPSLITEKTTNQELNQIREKGNSLFKEQIFYMAHQQKIAEISQKAATIQRELIELEMQRAKIQYIADTDANEEARMKQLIFEVETKKKTKAEELKTFQKEQEDFMKAARESAKQLGFEFDNLGKKWDKKEEIGKIPIKKELDPKAAEEERKKQLDKELKENEAAAQRKLAVLEKEKLEGKKTEEVYNEEYFLIKKAFLEKELSIYKKYKEQNSVEAANAAKELVEIEKNKQETLLKLKLGDVDKSTTAQKTLAENAFLLDTQNATKEEYEAREKKYKLRLLEIDETAAQEKILILEKSNVKERQEIDKQNNEILKIKANRKSIEQAELEEARKKEEEATEQRVNKFIEEEEQKMLVQQGIYKRRFATALMLEQDLQLAILESQKGFVEKQISLLEGGTKRQQELAEKKKTDLTKVEEDIATKKIENQQRAYDAELQIQQLKAGLWRDSFALAVDFLGQDEAARKRHSGAIKAFEVGQVWVNAYAEIAGIWKTANLNAINALIPGWGTAFATIQSGLALARAGAATSKIINTNMAEGGFTGLGTFRDETGERVARTTTYHEGEWVAPKNMVTSNPQLFNDLEAIRIGVSPKAVTSLTPQQNVIIIQQDNGIKELMQKVDNWQKDLNVNFSYTQYKDFQDNINKSIEIAAW